jgi:hypothetical protein
MYRYPPDVAFYIFFSATPLFSSKCHLFHNATFFFSCIIHILQDVLKCKVWKSVYHRTIQINHPPDAKIFQFIILMFVYSSTCFGRFPAHHQELTDCSGSLWFYIRIVVTVVLCLWLGWPAGLTTNIARLSPRYEGKTRGCRCIH